MVLSRKFSRFGMPLALVHALVGASVAAVTAPAFAANSTVEVMHQWTSSGEALAVRSIKDALAKQGVGWKDSAIAGGGGANQRQALQARLASGNAPVAAQAHALLLKSYKEQNALDNLDAVAKEGQWDSVLAPELIPYAKINGTYYGIPLNQHRENMLFINKKILTKYGDQVPATWDDFLVLAEKMKKDGLIPLALGGEDWQEAEIFSSILLGTGGPDLYRSTIIKQDPAALQSPEFKRVFDTFRKVLSYTDKNRAGRDWNVATQMVINGKAAMQIHADWAKGEFLTAGKKVDVDFICAAAPGNKQNFVFVSDFWVFFKQTKQVGQENQKVFAATSMDPAVQESFNLRKGSIPARMDVSLDKFDACAKLNIADRNANQKTGGMLPSFIENMGQPLPVRAVYMDVITKFANTPSQTPEAAVKKLVQGLKSL